jgi:LacI family transcriptional regulator
MDGPSSTGLQPSRDRGPLVAIVVDPSLPYDREIAKGVAEYAREVGDWQLYMEEEQGLRLPDLETWPGQGIIASFDDEAVARQVSAARLPVVAVGGGRGEDESGGIPYVATDNARIATLAAEHLLERAIPQFGYYGLPPTPVTGWSAARGEAFAARVAAAGRACHTLIARHDSTRWSLLQAELTAWLAALPTPVGIMACDDLRARHVLEACRTLRLRVPHDVAVIGVDDDELICELSDPPLSSVAQAARQIGHTAARLLHTLMRRAAGQPADGEKSAVPQLTVLPPLGVVSRRSTDTLAKTDPEDAILSERERDVLRLLAKGLVKREIADRLGLSPHTIDNYLRRIYAKLNVHTVGAAVAKGIRDGLL